METVPIMIWTFMPETEWFGTSLNPVFVQELALRVASWVCIILCIQYASTLPIRVDVTVE